MRFFPITSFRDADFGVCFLPMRLDFSCRRGFRVCGRDQRALRSPFGNLRSARSCCLIFIVAGNLHPCFLNSLLHEITEISQNKKPRAFPIPEKTRGASIYNCLQALEALAAVVEQGGVGAGVFHGNAAAENNAGLRVVGDAAGDVQGGVNRFGQARQSRSAAA